MTLENAVKTSLTLLALDGNRKRNRGPDAVTSKGDKAFVSYLSNRLIHLVSVSGDEWQINLDSNMQRAKVIPFLTSDEWQPESEYYDD
jgi:hypothetical protein